MANAASGFVKQEHRQNLPRRLYHGTRPYGAGDLRGVGNDCIPKAPPLVIENLHLADRVTLISFLRRLAVGNQPN